METNPVRQPSPYVALEPVSPEDARGAAAPLPKLKVSDISLGTSPSGKSQLFDPSVHPQRSLNPFDPLPKSKQDPLQVSILTLRRR